MSSDVPARGKMKKQWDVIALTSRTTYNAGVYSKVRRQQNAQK
jgi:hypothetical protein